MSLSRVEINRIFHIDQRPNQAWAKGIQGSSTTENVPRNLPFWIFQQIYQNTNLCNSGQCWAIWTRLSKSGYFGQFWTSWEFGQIWAFLAILDILGIPRYIPKPRSMNPSSGICHSCPAAACYKISLWQYLGNGKSHQRFFDLKFFWKCFKFYWVSAWVPRQSVWRGAKAAPARNRGLEGLWTTSS